jgi:hypothetical protein
MYKSDCPTWLCNEWGVPYDIYYFLGFVLLLLPYVFIWQKMFVKNKALLSSASRYLGVILLTLISALIYLFVLIFLGKLIDSHFILALLYVPMIVIEFLLIPAILITIFVSFFGTSRKQIKIEPDKDKNKNT